MGDESSVFNFHNSSESKCLFEKAREQKKHFLAYTKEHLPDIDLSFRAILVGMLPLQTERPDTSKNNYKQKKVAWCALMTEYDSHLEGLGVPTGKIEPMTREFFTHPTAWAATKSQVRPVASPSAVRSQSAEQQDPARQKHKQQSALGRSLSVTRSSVKQSGAAKAEAILGGLGVMGSSIALGLCIEACILQGKV